LTEPGHQTSIATAIFETPKADLGQLRDTLMREVERTLRRRLGIHIGLEASRRESNNDQAWLLYHRAERIRSEVEERSWIGSWDSLSVQKLQVADSLYAVAQSGDPKWGAPRVGRAGVAFLRASWSVPLSDFDRWSDVGMQHAKAALAADSNDVDALTAHGALDFRRWIRHRDIDLGRDSTLIHSARRHLERATAVGPNHAEAWYWRSELARYTQDFVSATFHAERAYAADAFLQAAPKLIGQIVMQYYNAQSWSESWRWCREGIRRYPDDPAIMTYQLMLLAATTQPRENADSAWRVYRRLEQITPSATWPYASRNAQIWVAGALAQAGMKDSARRVLVRARTNTEIDPSRNLLGQEAIIRETTLGDRDEALRLIAEYLVSNPGHRAGLARSPTWWFKEMRLDPRWRALVGLP
jgi:tetratricopeptide (TPR) repeat protein